MVSIQLHARLTKAQAVIPYQNEGCVGPCAKVVSISERPGLLLSLAAFFILFSNPGVSHLALGAVPRITPHTDPTIGVSTRSLIRLG